MKRLLTLASLVWESIRYRKENRRFKKDWWHLAPDRKTIQAEAERRSREQKEQAAEEKRKELGDDAAP